MTDYAPSTRLFVLYQKESAKGNMYLTGRLGNCKVAVVKTSKTTEDGQAMWNVLLSEKPREQSLSDKVKNSYDDMLSDDEAPY